MNEGQVNDCVGELQMRLWLDPIEEVSPSCLPKLVDSTKQITDCCQTDTIGKRIAWHVKVDSHR